MPTVYVATRANADTGALEWRSTEAERDEVLLLLKEGGRPGDDFGTHTVVVPADVWSEGTEAITDYVYGVTDF